MPRMHQDQSPKEQREKGEAVQLHTISPSFFRARFYSLPSSQLPLGDPRSFTNKNIDVTLSKVSAANVLRIMRN